MIIEVLRRAWHAIGFEIFRRGIEIGRHRAQLALDQVRLVRRPQADGAFGLQLQQVIFAAVIKAQVEIHVRMLAGKPAQARHQPGRAERHRRRHDQFALWGLLLVLQQGIGRLRCCRHFHG